MKEEWLRKVLKVSQKVENNWDGPDGDNWKMERIFTGAKSEEKEAKDK
jgi:hypothetical protein